MTPTPRTSPSQVDPPGTDRRRARLRSLAWYWGPIVLYMLAIFIGSSISTLPSFAENVPDKVAHFFEYAVLGFLLARGLAGRRWLSITFPYVAGAIALAAVYGASDELHQLFVPGRNADVRDLATDVLGAVVSTGALWAWGIIRRNFKESELANQE